MTVKAVAEMMFWRTANMVAGSVMMAFAAAMVGVVATQGVCFRHQLRQ